MRKLNDKDNEILQKLAPEASIPTHYRSILPPVSMHFAADDEDLQDRLKRLSKEDLKYLAERILDGSECLPVSYTHLRAHETPEHLVCRLLLEKKKQQQT